MRFYKLTESSIRRHLFVLNFLFNVVGIFCTCFLISEIFYNGDISPARDDRVERVISECNGALKQAPYMSFFYSTDITDNLRKTVTLGVKSKGLISAFKREGFIVSDYSDRPINFRQNSMGNSFKPNVTMTAHKHDKVFRVQKNNAFLPMFNSESCEVFLFTKKNKVADFLVRASKETLTAIIVP